MSLPLLRFASVADLSPVQIAAHSYGGVVVEINASVLPELAAMRHFARECHRAALDFYLDISRFPRAGLADLRRHFLQFEGEEPHVVISDSDRLDPFNSQSAQRIIAWLREFDATLITGVLAEIPRDEASEFGSPFPPFPWSPLLARDFNDTRLMALVSNTGKDAARQRQEYWHALNALLADHFRAPLERWCSAHSIVFRFRAFAPECKALRLNRALRARLDADSLWPPLLSGDSADALLHDAYQLFAAGAARFQVAYTGRTPGSGTTLLNAVLARTVENAPPATNAARVGVLFPQRSCRTHYHPNGHRFTRWVGDDLAYLCALLDELHFDWIFVREDEDWRALELIVVPGVTALARATWQRLEARAENGGKVACLGLLPRWSERGRDAEFEAAVGRAARVVVEDLYTAYAAQENDEPLPPTIGFPVFREYPGGGRLCSYQPRLNPDAEDARLRVRQILHESMAPDLETQSPALLYSHRVSERRDDFFVFNRSNELQRFRLHLQPYEAAAPGLIKALDPATGDARVLAVWMEHPREQGGGLSLSLDLAAGEARRLQITEDEAGEHLESATFEVEYFDGTMARGYAVQSGTQKIALRRRNKIEWRAGGDVVMPTPLLLDDWEEVAPGEYARRVILPPDWDDCRVFLEVAPLRGLVEVMANGAACGARLAAPLRFDLTAVAAATPRPDALHIVLHIEENQDEPEILARLTAHPKVQISTREQGDDE